MVGSYRGGGTWTLFSVGSFATDPARTVPIGFVEMDTRDFTRGASGGVIHFQEKIEYWFLEDANLLAQNSFLGVGYCKAVKRQVQSTGDVLTLDTEGFPNPIPDATKPLLH